MEGPHKLASPFGHYLKKALLDSEICEFTVQLLREETWFIQEMFPLGSMYDVSI